MNISFLGTPNRNPLGWYYWAIAISITGLMLIPILLYIGKSFCLISKFILITGTVLFLSFVIGMIGLGIIPQFTQLTMFHEINVFLAFGGIFLFFIFLWLVLLFNKDNEQFKKDLNWKSLGFLGISFLLPVIGIFTSFLVCRSIGGLV